MSQASNCTRYELTSNAGWLAGFANNRCLTVCIDELADFTGHPEHIDMNGDRYRLVALFRGDVMEWSVDRWRSAFVSSDRYHPFSPATSDVG